MTRDHSAAVSLPGDTDIAHQNIDPAPTLFYFARKPESRGGVGDVGDVKGDIAADVTTGRLEVVVAACRKRDLGALGGERVRNRQTDAAAGADHEGDPIVKLEVHRAASSSHRTVMSRYVASAPA
jgi:hypothetical protein